ncbi:hypothetical protein [Collimonas humicola]|uniref:hypothetical protein n=1 Tax=Collimonas humicola TaxID=2825886 RepID=UPI001B8BDC65|nr:hypothetical protein [Collimonas humicola]
MASIGDRIEVILEEMEGQDRGKQVRLADHAGCTKSLIGQLLRNPGQNLGYKYAKNIEQSLGYRVEWILKGILPKLLPVQSESVELDEVAELILLFRQATDESRERILTFAREVDRVPENLRKPIRLKKAGDSES